MNPNDAPLALIAEDEPLLADNLRAELARLWPALRFADPAGDGASAVRRALALRPDLLFLDIRMPGMTGLEAAQALAEDWPEGVPFPLLVFVTAYDQYALEAFERAAVDYVQKPVQPERLARTVTRLQAALAARRADVAAPLADAVERLRSLLGDAAPAAEPLRVIQAGAGNAIHLVPVDEVLYFEAADKYVRVVTAGREHLIRTALRELLPQLDATRFWQIHRGTVVRCDAVEAATRDESGRVTLTLRGRPDKLVVSRLYAQRFRAM
ncbi:MAG: LytR/AlgR family response regulator transcription factor [Betaproteobacteria bacterium]